jgi:phosphatidate cytidylyltransferase
MGAFVLVPCWASINYIRNQDEGPLGLLFLFVLIWGADSAAYFVGKKWGTKRLAPYVSPGKSWQGLMGALLVSTLIVLTTLWLCNVPFPIWPWAIVLSLVTVLFSIVGDLFESMIKRQAKVKDSGKLLPGHGGVLDRIDSLTAAAPIFVLGALLLGPYL